ncbi:hypothetical protein DY000_02063446 [Brassica cretica]|uniref:Uncharacterized protein n=1 Tax=Brassica cretica TaxID=69181 RepID=A0ABQ7B3H5_BRACR|nr:hypothetical protein DY000_02063446 [Brassica cretica]
MPSLTCLHQDVSETFHPQGTDWYKEPFAWFLSTGMRSCESEIADYKRRLFDNLSGKAEKSAGYLCWYRS